MKARSQLFKDLYQLLRHLARKRLAGEQAAGSATSLVHDAYLKLSSNEEGFNDEEHFLATASSVMRQILVDRARARMTKKRNSIIQPLTLCVDEPPQNGESVIDVLLLNELLDRLAGFDARAAQVTEMRVFLGLDEEEIATVLGVSSRTIKRDWVSAKAWLVSQARCT